MNKYFSYSKQWIDEDDIEAVVAALNGDYLTGGKLVDSFEEKFAIRINAKYAVAVANGTAALHIAYSAAGLAANDNIITSPVTFAATANAALYNNANVSFVDIESTGNIDPNKITAAITSSTKIIVPVHYAGQPTNMLEIYNIAKAHDLLVVEDACHALGAKYKDSLIGSCQYSDMTVFSFHPVKQITTGEGGMITTNSKALYDKMKLLRNHGIVTSSRWQKNMTMLGYNYRITDIQCALGISQLSKLDTFINERKRVAMKYDALLLGSEFFCAVDVGTNLSHAYHLYPILLNGNINREKFMQHADNAGIGLQIHYSAVYAHQYYRENGFANFTLPVADDFTNRVVSIPIYPKLSDPDIEYIVRTLTKIARDCDG